MQVFVQTLTLYVHSKLFTKKSVRDIYDVLSSQRDNIYALFITKVALIWSDCPLLF